MLYVTYWIANRETYWNFEKINLVTTQNNRRPPRWFIARSGDLHFCILSTVVLRGILCSLSSISQRRLVVDIQFFISTVFPSRKVNTIHSSPDWYSVISASDKKIHPIPFVISVLGVLPTDCRMPTASFWVWNKLPTKENRVFARPLKVLATLGNSFLAGVGEIKFLICPG